MTYTTKYNEDFTFSVITKHKIVADKLTLCQAISLCNEFNYLATIINIIGEDLDA